MAIDLTNLTITKARQELDAKKYSAVELAQAYLDKIKEKNPELNAYLEIYNDVLEQAKKADEIMAAGKTKILTGIPLAIKDNILIKGKKASGASKILENYVASYNATVIEKLKAEGAVFLGRTNMDEFAMGGSGENSAYGPTKNPHDPSRVPGGSSAGSAAVVGADLCVAALGSDTGGSIRQPASFCGIVGLKPTYGTVSRSGLMAMASSLDQIGPMTKTVEDAEILYQIIAGQDPMDSTSVSPTSNKPKEKMIIGVPFAAIEKGLDEEVKKNFEASLEKLKKLGHEIKDVSLPNIGYALACYYVLMPAEASTNLARFDGVRYGLHVDGENLLADYKNTRGEGFGKEVRRRIMLGAYVLSAGYYDAYYGQAIKVRQVISDEFAAAFGVVDAIALPTAPTPAFKIGEKTSDPLTMYLEDIFTVPANIAGIPAISVPSGKTAGGLPLGLQLMAPHFGEQTIFQLAKSFAGE